ncbi:hypothetical protein PNEG_01055 [Pneumocystis murina B123]|uniref:Uncharacterized protein n=1 Tax=Pneumocystis murina (strain B123) TaxID=1069680 RepID=M7PKD0_PNEMU|nr:hypothetical protein PNEG_01055 [Pneumocystis murina B123]EMR10909.1 hypothetical protein PNEG_01055 [Pneumocystis murina B123]
METKIISPPLSSVLYSKNIPLPAQETIMNNVQEHYTSQTPIKSNNSKYQSRIVKLKVNISRLASQSEPVGTPMSSPLPMSSPVLASSPVSNIINNGNIIKKTGKKARLSNNTGPKTIRRRKAEAATVIVINVEDASQKQGQQNIVINGQKTGSTPLSHSRLGPKANTGAINAGLRALDRSGKPCKRWYKRMITIDCINGIQWETNGWKDTSAS